MTGSSTFSVQAEQALVLPPEAYAAIPADAAGDGLSNIRSTLFVGREAELAFLDQAFTGAGEVVVHALHGLGGVGKSALAAHWAARRAEPVRWRITADTADAVRTGLAELAGALQPGLAGLPEAMLVERALRWLAGNDGWLLVLDNAEDPADLAPLLERVPRGRVLVTTRRAGGWHRAATTIRLDVLRAGESVDLFVRVLTHQGPRDSEGADAVCEELGHLALAVEQAAAYCAQSGTTPRAYRAMLARWPADMFAAAAEGTHSERTIARIWHLTLDSLADTPLAGRILRILAWYAPDAIPRELLDHLSDGPEGPGTPRVTTAIGRLLAYNMITDNHDGTLSVHRLVQALARTPDPADPHRRPEDITTALHLATDCLRAALDRDPDQPAHWPALRALLPHVDALTDHAPAGTDTEATAAALNVAGHFLTRLGQARRAIPHFRRGLDTAARVMGDEAPGTLESRNNLAVAYQEAGDLARAVPLFERTLADRSRVLGEDAPDTLLSRNNLARAYVAVGETARAVLLHERTLADRSRVLGEDAPDTLLSRNNLATAYHEAGDFARATSLHEHNLRAMARIMGEDAPTTLTVRNNLAMAYQGAGDLARAVPLFERTLADRLRVLGEDAPETLVSRNNLARAYQSVGDLARAVPLHEQNLQAVIRVMGEDAPNTLTVRGNLALAYQEAGDLARAVPLHERTLADRLRVLGEEAPDTLTSRGNLASAYQEAGDLARAVPLHERTLADRLRVLGEDAPDTLTSRNNLAIAYQVIGDPARALPLHEQNLEAMIRIVGDQAPNTVASRHNLAHAHRAAGDITRAILLFRAVVEGRSRLFGSGHRDTAKSRADLAETLTERGRSLLPDDRSGAWQAAAEAVGAVGPHLADDPGAYGPALGAAYELAADVLLADGQPEAAAEYRSRARHVAPSPPNTEGQG